MDEREDSSFGEGMFEEENVPSDEGIVEDSPGTNTEFESDGDIPTANKHSDDGVSSPPEPLDSGGPARMRTARDSEDMSDAAEVTATPEPRRTETGRPIRPGQWDRELSAHRIAVELKKIEEEVRQLLADRDPKRKRRLAGTRRWFELEEDVLSLKFQGRIDESSLDALQRLIARRHHLFGRLRFLAHTRPTWNS